MLQTKGIWKGGQLQFALFFFDASESGYRQAKYLRLVDAAGKVHCSLVIAKS